MKALSNNYVSSNSTTYETFGDLVFCALVVLTLFVVTLAVEVSQRVRSHLVMPDVVSAVEVAGQVETLSPEEVKILSERLQKQRFEMGSQHRRLAAQEQTLKDLHSRVFSQEKVLKEKIAALAGEQRFTGATEPARLQLAYNYKAGRFVFVRRKEFVNATTRNTGESDLAYSLRQKTELARLAVLSRTQRHFTHEEANAIYSGFSLYKEISPTDRSYSVASARLGINYSAGLSGHIAGDAELPRNAVDMIESVMNLNFNETGADSDAMYPSVLVQVRSNDQTVIINNVVLSAKDFKDLLLAVSGRGVMLDFSGYTGAAPEWLIEQVLTPTGYVGKTPKLPSD